MDRNADQSFAASRSGGWIIAPDEPSLHALEVPVLQIFDGDGFLTRVKLPGIEGDLFGEREVEATIRFGFVDAPEMDQPGGREARECLVSLIGGQSVWISILLKMDTGKTVDRYGRIVCVPYIKTTYDDCVLRAASGPSHRMALFGEPFVVSRNVELEMVLNGWAWVLERYGPDGRYIDALEEARRHRRGIWARDDNVHPWTFKKRKASERRGRAAPLLDQQICPCVGCGGRLLRKHGRYGDFLGCSRYPDCKYTRSAAAT